MMVAGIEPLVTSLYDWETSCIVPALLSDPLVAAGPVDLITDEDGGPCVTRLPEDPTPADYEIYASWARHYIEVCYFMKALLLVLPFSQPRKLTIRQQLYHDAPDYEVAMRTGKDVRHLWFTLRDWRGGNSESFFGALGGWADKRYGELRATQ